MDTLNNAYFFVVDKIIDLQSFFWKEAWAIGRIVLFIAIISAAVNYAISGAGLKDNMVKIGKALVFFIVIMLLYPRIIGHITYWTFSKAQAGAYSSIARYIEDTKETIIGNSNPKTYAARIIKEDPGKYFNNLTNLITTRKYGSLEYTVVAPAAAMELLLLIAGECLSFSENQKGINGIGKAIMGMICAFFVIFAGVLAVLEYLMAFLEYMFITSVGIILFPLSLWEGSKFMAEKLIGAIMGFFIKLLFCNICIFLMLYGFLSLVKGYTVQPFTGQPDEIVTLIFISLLYFFLSKSAPALAQSLLTGTPSLSAGGVIGAAKGAVAGAAATLGVAKMAGGAVAGGAAKTLFAGSGALTQAASAASTASKQNGNGAAAFMSSLGGSAMEALKSSGGDLARSLLGGGGHGGGGAGGAGAGLNRHSDRQNFLEKMNADGTKQTFKEHKAARKAKGAEIGNLQIEKLTNPGAYYTPPDKE
jgi:hypothetical protein